MIKNQNIICISSIDWDFVWQQHQAIMSAFSANKNKVLFIENTGIRTPGIKDSSRIIKRLSNWLKSTKGFKEEMKNLYVYSPLLLPFPYLRIARWINRYFLSMAIKRWSKAAGFYEPIIWTFLPTPIVLDLIKEIPHKVFVYYCTDNFSATSKSARKILKYEKLVIKKADIVFVMAHNMHDYCARFNKNVICIPMGVNKEVFVKSNESPLIPGELAGINSPIIGYIGGVRQSLDLTIIKYLAQNLPEYIFMFIGPIQTDITALRSVKNIVFTGEKPHPELPNFIRNFCACIMPYKIDAYTNNVSPGKLNEYLIMGKPVISTKLKEVENINKESGNIIYIANSCEKFKELILKALSEDSEELRNKRVEFALNNSWDKKIEAMSQFIESAIRNKETTLSWQRNLIKTYKDVRKKAAIFAAATFLLLFPIFYTPLVWFLAKPLKISQAPRHADAIVVFAGGVGESGQAGQGYEERVKYAVELYKKGYAENIIFSSGYVYAFEESAVMKALAVSLGVREENILLEDKAKSTYENIKFTKEILDRKGYKDILLISSPYHMLRAKLVFDKVAKEISVCYTPIKYSFFYSTGKRDSLSEKQPLRKISLKQIKGILHEYLGILYYWHKSYI